MSDRVPNVRTPRLHVKREPQIIAYSGSEGDIVEDHSLRRWIGVVLMGLLALVEFSRSDATGGVLFFTFFIIQLPAADAFLRRRWRLKTSGGLGIKIAMSSLVLAKSCDVSGGPHRVVTHREPQAVIGETCATLTEKFGSASTLSSLQRQVYWEKYIRGRTFHWDLRMVDVAATDGELVAHYRCPESNDDHATEITLRFPATAHGDVLNFSPGVLYAVGGEFADRFEPGKLNAFALPTGTRAPASAPR